MLIIISGIPCTGKTSFGDWLKDEHEYFHFDFEKESKNGIFHPLLENIQFKNIDTNLIKLLSTLSNKIVITWGFPPNEYCFNIIENFQNSGFQPWWFSTDMDIARNYYIQRDGLKNTELFFDIQAKKLTATEDRISSIYKQSKIETLTKDGYMERQQILEMISKNY